MEALLIIAAIAVVVAFLWLNLLATLAIRNDCTLERVQKIAQSLAVWFVPFIGAGFVLHLVVQHNPQALPRAWIPWPINRLVHALPASPNKNRDETEIDFVGGVAGRNSASHRERDASEDQ